jgi:hypothetical protein
MKQQVDVFLKLTLEVDLDKGKEDITNYLNGMCTTSEYDNKLSYNVISHNILSVEEEADIMELDDTYDDQLEDFLTDHGFVVNLYVENGTQCAEIIRFIKKGVSHTIDLNPFTPSNFIHAVNQISVTEDLEQEFVYHFMYIKEVRDILINETSFK